MTFHKRQLASTRVEAKGPANQKDLQKAIHKFLKKQMLDKGLLQSLELQLKQIDEFLSSL